MASVFILESRKGSEKLLYGKADDSGHQSDESIALLWKDLLWKVVDVFNSRG